MRKHISYLFITLGVFFLVYGSYLFYLRYSPNKLSFTSYIPDNSTQVATDAQPIELNIPDLNINTSITSSTIKNDIWETSSTGVSYLNLSPVPGEKGNSILYGHNWTSTLGNLYKIKPGETIQITYADNSTKNFVVEYTSVVTPDETDIIEQTSDTRLTIYTCTGFLDSKRFVVVAKLQS
ncbi:sortase [Candidatus Roizmanbacteria bacterium]|nr:sortase [Candidatus Roizmanbacteria bacterium]